VAKHTCQHCNYLYIRNDDGSLGGFCKCRKCHATDDAGNYENMQTRIAELEKYTRQFITELDASRAMVYSDNEHDRTAVNAAIDQLRLVVKES